MAIIFGFIVNSVPALAVNQENLSENYDIRSISSESMFEGIFGATENPYTSMSATAPFVNYTVQIVPSEDGIYNVNIDFVICNSNRTYPANASGTAEEITLESGGRYISGPLDGEISTPENDTYKIIVGFQSELNSQEISAGVNIINGDENLYFAFGKYVMPDEIYEKFQSTGINTDMPENDDIVTDDSDLLPASDTEYLHRGGDASIDENGNYIGILDTYYSEYRDVLFATLTSDSESLLVDDFFSTCRVYSAHVEFNTTDHDAGIERFYYLPGSENVGSDLGDFIADVFNDAVSLAGIPIPTSTILRAIRATLSGGITTNIPTSERTATFDTKLTTSGNFDEAPLPVAIELYGTVPGTYNYKTTANIRYICTMIKDIYYVDTDDMTTSSNLEVS